MNESPPLPSRPLKAFAAVAKWSLVLLLAAWLALALAWGALHGWIVPRIGELRPELEIQATRALGVPVRIGAIAARSGGLIPSFELSDVVLLDSQGREALRLPRVLAALSPQSLLKLAFEQLYIDAPELDIRRTVDGRIFVAGLDLSRSSDNDGRAAEWFFSQGEFAIRGGTVRWTDEMRGAPPLALADVDFVSRNSARRHSMRLDATPPPQWGARFMLAGEFREPLLSGGNGRWQHWVGQLHADFAQVDLSQLRRHADLGIRLGAGKGALRAWADIDKGQIAGGTADVVLTDVDVTLGTQLEPLALSFVSGRVGGRRFAEGFEFETRNLQFRTADGQVWPGGNVFVSWSQGQGQRPAQGELRADRLDLGALGLIGRRLPLGAATHKALQTYAPAGLVETVQAKWQGPAAAPTQYEARGRARGLVVAAHAPTAGGGAASPGVRGASVDFELTQGSGRARLAIERGAVEFPGVFEEPSIPVDSLSAELQWQVDGPRLALAVQNLKFSNADAQGEGQLSWRTSDAATGPEGPRFPGVLDLQASLSRADGTRVFRYLPLGVPKEARDYVRDSVLQGQASNAKFRVKGDLRDFPFEDGRGGEFSVSAQVNGATYAYVPRRMHSGPGAWPALTQLSGELVFRGNGMEVRGAAGRFAGAPGLQVLADARIADFDTTRVAVSGQVKGPLAESLAVVNGSPAGAMVNNALARARAAGAAQLSIKMDLPVSSIEQSKVQGTVTLAGNELHLAPDVPVLSRARGVVTFSERGFSLAGAQARALGGDVRIEGGTRPAGGAEAPVLLRAQGTATAEGLRQARELGFVSRLARDMTGATSYTVQLGFRHGTPEVLVSSSLQGLGVNLPAPLAKPAEASLPLRYESALTPASRDPAADPARLQDRLSVDLGRILSASYLRDLSGAQPQVLRGGIAVGLAPGESAPQPEEGVMANIQLAAFDVDAWEAVLDRAAAVPGGAPAAGALRAGGEGAAAMGYLPTLMAVRAKELQVEGRTLHDVVVGGSRDGRTWRANVEARELNGYLEYRQPAGAGAGRVHARLARLSVGASTARAVEALLDRQPESIPALDVVVEDFELKGRKLGRLEIEAVNRGAGTVAREGGVREWRLNRLALINPEAIFTATGNWVALNAQAVAPGGPRPEPSAPGERRRTVMNFQLYMTDAGVLLARLGMKDLVRRGRGRMEGQVAWIGSPLTLDYPSLSGGFNVNVEGGQFLKADPGLGKLLGVLSLQSLPRRLALDFRDVFSEGFAFDFVRGDVTIERGVAATNNLQMKGVNAAVLMEGKADLARETQDLKVVVVPEINAGTASLVATVINPAIGLGSFLAQLFLRQPLIRAATQEFHVDGTWADPRVTKVNRAPTASGQSAAPVENR